MRLIISIILIASAVAVLFLWGRPMWADIQVKLDERAAYESALLRLNRLRGTRDSLISSYNSIPETDLTKIKNFLPASVNSGLLVVQISNMTSQNGLLLKGVNISEPDQRTGEAKISLAVSGSYANFISFLKTIERSLRLIDVSQISFSAGTEDFYDFAIEAKIYTQK